MSTGQAGTADDEGFVPRISTIAGSGTAGFGGDDGAAVSAQLKHPYEMAVSSTGILYVSDYSNHRVRRITTDGKIGTVAGTGAAGSAGDGGPAAKAQLNKPFGLAVDGEGVLYVAEFGGHRVRRVGADGVIRTVVGTAAAGAGVHVARNLFRRFTTR
ncbi:NHL domain-containing protein [Streptomyces sp. NPDC055107]